MTTGNKLGIGAIAALLLSAGIELPHPKLAFLSIFLELASLSLFVVAGIKGSRWWFVVPVTLIGMLLFVMSRGV